MMSRRGQSTVEFAIMIPVIFAALFLIVELAFLFGSTHYVNYAAFAAARAQQVGESATDAADLLLDGNVTKNATVRANTGAGSVKIEMPWEMDLPFTSGFADFDYDVTVVAGPEEARYEGTTGNGKQAKRYGDNQCGSGC
jgi:Flp pilus assembly protein TadG